MVHLPQHILHTELVHSSLAGLFQMPRFTFVSPSKKAPGPFPEVSQCSFPTANLPGGKAGLSALGDDNLHSSFTQPTATLATSKEPLSNLRLNFHKTEPFIFLIPLHSWRSLNVQEEQPRLPHSISASYSLWQFGTTLRLCQGKCQQGPCPDKDTAGSFLMFEMK